MKVEFKGAKSFIAKLGRTASLVKGETQKATRSVAEDIFAESQILVPVDTGALRASGRVDFYGSRLKPEAEISYSTEYARIVHEVEWYYHKPPTQAKYLEEPLGDAGVMSLGRFSGAVAASIKGAF